MQEARDAVVDVGASKASGDASDTSGVAAGKSDSGRKHKTKAKGAFSAVGPLCLSHAC